MMAEVHGLGSRLERTMAGVAGGVDDGGGRGSRGIAAPRGMSAHSIIGGSTQYLVLRPGHTVVSNPHVGLLISQFA